MGIETTPWDAAEFLDSDEAVLGYVEAVFEHGDAELIAAALNDICRAKGLEGRADGGGGPRRGHRDLEGTRPRAYRQGGLTIVEEHRQTMLEAWHEYFG